MSHAQPFTPEEKKKIKQLKKLLTQSVVELETLRRAWKQVPRRSIWIDLLRHVEEHESQRLLKLDEKLDLKRVLVWGVAWKTADGGLFYTWPGAPDCRPAPEGALTILYVMDLLTGRLKPHPTLMVVAQWMLGVSPSSDIEGESERFLKQLSRWKRLAEQNLAKGRPSTKLQDLLENVDGHESEDERRKSYEKAEKHYITSDAKAAPRRKNNAAHNRAIDLFLLCEQIRKDMRAPQHDIESRFGLINLVLSAARRADQLEHVANEANAQNILKMMEKRGPDPDLFAEKVRAACESCWVPAPWKKPALKQILEALGARIEKKTNGSYVVPKAPDEQTWKEHPRKHFDNAVIKWARSKGSLLAGVERARVGEQMLDR